jgi:hypothetical protein
MMLKPNRHVCLALRWTLLACLAAGPAGWLAAQETRTKAPEWRHAFELKARQAGKSDFKDAQKYGIEVFLDPNTGKLVYLCETGSIGVVPATGAAGDKAKEPTWQHAMDLRVRKAGEGDFTEKTKKFGVEVFRDENNGNLIYICETGAIAVVPGGPATMEKSKSPEWKHAMELAARKASEKDFGKDTRRYGIEVFRDENNGNLIYICETGALAVVPGVPALPDKIKAPEFKFGLVMKVRKGGEADFNDKTQKLGAEAFLDPNSGKLVYISETGWLSVPAAVQVTDPKAAVKAPDWKHGIELKARKAGEVDWDKARKVGLEIYLDENTGSLVYIAENGALCDLPK